MEKGKVHLKRKERYFPNEYCSPVIGKLKTKHLELTTIVFEEDPNNVWFLANEICDLLRLSNPRDVINDHIDKCYHKQLKYSYVSQNAKTLWWGNDYSNKNIINQTGLLYLIMRSKSPIAVKLNEIILGRLSSMLIGQASDIIDDVMDEFFSNVDSVDELYKPVYTYLVKDQTGKIKIGKTVDFGERLNGLRRNTGSKEDNVITPILLLNGDFENELHRKFSKQRINREWFDLSEEDVEAIKRKYKSSICNMITQKPKAELRKAS